MGALKLSYLDTETGNKYPFMKVVHSVNEPSESRLNSYLFGSTIPGRRFHGNDYRYSGAQGNELAENSKWSNFELRMLNSDLGRWISPDPYGQFASPYIAMGNVPTIIVDPTGGYGNNSTQGSTRNASEEANANGDYFSGGGRKKKGESQDEEFFDFTGWWGSGGGNGYSAGYEGGSMGYGVGAGSAIIIGNYDNGPGYNTTYYDPTAGKDARYTRDANGKLVPKMADGTPVTSPVQSTGSTESKPEPSFLKYQTNGRFDAAKVEMDRIQNMKPVTAKSKFASPPKGEFIQMGQGYWYGAANEADAYNLMWNSAKEDNVEWNAMIFSSGVYVYPGIDGTTGKSPLDFPHKFGKNWGNLFIKIPGSTKYDRLLGHMHTHQHPISYKSQGFSDDDKWFAVALKGVPIFMIEASSNYLYSGFSPTQGKFSHLNRADLKNIGKSDLLDGKFSLIKWLQK